MPAKPTRYEHDFYAWSHEQAALLRSGKVSRADPSNIAEEIETLGKAKSGSSSNA
jgi:hypothetical protein